MKSLEGLENRARHGRASVAKEQLFYGLITQGQQSAVVANQKKSEVNNHRTWQPARAVNWNVQ